MRILALMNDKGGSGKTTTAVSLAAVLGEMGHRVLLIDLDPQAWTTTWLLGPRPPAHQTWASTQPSMRDVLLEGEEITDAPLPTYLEGVELIPASDGLNGIERTLNARTWAPAPERVFRDTFTALQDGPWSFVLVDCPPSLGFLSSSVLAACSEILIPVEASAMGVQGFDTFLTSVDRIRERFNAELSVTGALMCRVDTRTRISRDAVQLMREVHRQLVLKTVIRECVRIKEAPTWGKAITTYAEKSHAADDYRAAAKELLERKPGARGTRTSSRRTRSVEESTFWVLQ